MVIDTYVTRMHNKISIHRGAGKTVLTNEDDSILAVMKDIKHQTNRGGADTEKYKLIDCDNIYAINDSGTMLFATEQLGIYESYEDPNTISLIDSSNTILRSNEELHDMMLEWDKEYTLCFNHKLDHNGNRRIILVYAIRKDNEKIVHIKNLPNINKIDPEFVFSGMLGTDFDDEDCLTGWHLMVTKGMDLIINPNYERIMWIVNDPTNKKLIIDDFFDENFITKCDDCIDEVNHYVYNEEFIGTIKSMRDNYQSLVQDLVAVDMGISRLYKGNKPDNVLALETNNLYMKYNFGFMVNRRYTDIKYMKTLMVSSIKKMETLI